MKARTSLHTYSFAIISHNVQVLHQHPSRDKVSSYRMLLCNDSVSRVAQWKRAWPITQRSMDPLLNFVLNYINFYNIFLTPPLFFKLTNGTYLKHHPLTNTTEVSSQIAFFTRYSNAYGYGYSPRREPSKYFGSVVRRNFPKLENTKRRMGIQLQTFPSPVHTASINISRIRNSYCF